MEEKKKGHHIPESAAKQEGDSPRKTIGYHPRVFPSMPSHESDPTDSTHPAPQATPSHCNQMPGIEQTPGHDVQMPATHHQAEPGELGAGRIVSSKPVQHSDFPDSPLPSPQATSSTHNQMPPCPDQMPGYDVQPTVSCLQKELGELSVGGILSSMSVRESGSPDSPPPAPQSALYPYNQIQPDFEQTPGYVQSVATYPHTEPGGLRPGGILPSMPVQESEYLDSPPPVPSPYTQMPPGFEQAPCYNVEPVATHPQTEPGGLGAAGIFPASSHFGYHLYSAAPPRTWTYSTWSTSTAGMPPMQTYPGHDSYQATYGYDSTGQCYSHGTNTPMPYSSRVAVGSQPGHPAPQAQSRSIYAGVVAGPMYDGAAQACPHYGSGYPQQYPSQAGYDYHALPSRGQSHHQGNRSYALRPGRPYFEHKKRDGPDGANLFVFHIPNDMTNKDMKDLFQPHGNVLSVRIMTEKHTGRGRGFGFVSYDSAESAARAIHSLNGYQLQGKRLKVQRKQVNGKMNSHAKPYQPHQPRLDRSPVGFGPLKEPVQEPAHVPVQEPVHVHVQEDYAGSSHGCPEPPPVLPPVGEHHHRLEPAHLLPPVDEHHYHRKPTMSFPPVDEPHHCCDATPVLPPTYALDEGGESASPLADLEDIGNAISDSK